MKIALIDTGVSQNDVINKANVRHFSLNEDRIVEEYKKPRADHGTNCYKEIVAKTKNSEIQILDFNISDDSGEIQVLSIVSAIEKAIEERVDIINISLGITVYSQELYDACEKAVQNNIVILSAASHSNTVSFPADFNNVICVKVDQKQTENFKRIDSSTVSVLMLDYIIKENDIEFDFSSSSMACARLCGYFCNELCDVPLNDKYRVLSKRYNIVLHKLEKKQCSVEASEIQQILAINRVAIVLFPENELKRLKKDMLNKNIVAYYDYDKEDFLSFTDGNVTKEFDVIILLNSLYHDLEIPATIKEKYADYKILYIGNFLKKNNNEKLREYNEYNSQEMTILEKPIIAITSLCSGLNKFEVQASLLNSFKQDGLNVKMVANNPLGILYDMEIFNFPIELKFPDVVYSINRFMYLAEANKNIDAWLINIGGAVGQVNKLNTYNFGKLADAYFLASNIDVAIMCVPTFVDASNLRLQLSNLYKHGVQKIFIVLSHNDIDASTMDYRDGVQTYYVGDLKYHQAFEYLRANMEEKVFMLDDVISGKMYEHILEALG